MSYPSYFNYKAANWEFKKTQGIASNNFLIFFLRELELRSQLDFRLFLNLMKHHKKTPRQQTPEVIYKDINYKAENVIRVFEKYFIDIFDTHELNPKGELQIEVYETLDNYARTYTIILQ